MRITQDSGDVKVEEKTVLSLNLADQCLRRETARIRAVKMLEFLIIMAVHLLQEGKILWPNA